MEGVEAYGFSAAMSGAFLLSSLLFAAVNRRLREPYMDEVFHVPQAQAYCQGRFLQWDPMITTPPGLYLLSVGVVKPAAWLFGWTGSVVCSTGMLRFINLLISAGNFYLLYLLLLKIHQKNKGLVWSYELVILVGPFQLGMLYFSMNNSSWEGSWEVKPAAWLFGWTGSVVCSTGMLRFINLLISAGNFYLLYLLLLKIHQKNKAVSGFQRILSSLTLATFPTLYFFTFLYYTDTGSVFFTLFAYLMCLYGNHKASALLGFCAFMFRQTNIVWTVFCAGNVVAEKLNEAWKTELLKKKDERISSMRTSFSDLTLITRFLIEYLISPKNLITLIALTWPYIVLVTAFFVFVFVNGGIVVGDRSSHEACLHFPQLFYFLSFTLFFSFPHLLTPTKIRKFLQSLRRHRVQYILITAISLFLIWNFTYVHKYLLADNRHYTFYVWRKIFQRHELVKYVLVPAYIFAGWSFVDTIKSKSIFWILMYFVCLLSVTVPQKLLEFRYFILPFLIYRLNIPFPPVYRQLVELAFYIVVNAATFYLFLNRTFQWPNSVEIQRFMW